MRVNTQFPVAVHILAVLAFFGDKPCSSEVVGRSVGTNPVVVRRIVSQLKKAGLVKTGAGSRGTTLRKAPGEITLLEVYRALHPSEEALFDLHPNPSLKCPIGAYIHEAVNAPLSDAQQAMEERLASYTVRDVAEGISQRNGLALGQLG